MNGLRNQTVAAGFAQTRYALLMPWLALCVALALPGHAQESKPSDSVNEPVAGSEEVKPSGDIVQDDQRWADQGGRWIVATPPWFKEFGDKIEAAWKKETGLRNKKPLGCVFELTRDGAIENLKPYPVSGIVGSRKEQKAEFKIIKKVAPFRPSCGEISKAPRVTLSVVFQHYPCFRIENMSQPSIPYTVGQKQSSPQVNLKKPPGAPP